MGVIRLDSRLWDPDWIWRHTYLRWLSFIASVDCGFGYTYEWLHHYSSGWVRDWIF